MASKGHGDTDSGRLPPAPAYSKEVPPGHNAVYPVPTVVPPPPSYLTPSAPPVHMMMSASLGPLNAVYPSPTNPGFPPPGYVTPSAPPMMPAPFGHPNAVYPAPTNPGIPPVPPGYVPPPVPAMMPAPPPDLRPTGCPPGLEYLIHVDQLLVHQTFHLAELLGWEVRNSYNVKNSIGQQVFLAEEENNCCTLQCFGPSRPFTFHIQDNLGQEVLTLTRPLACSYCCFPCCLQDLEVQSPPGIPIGYVVQECHPFLPKLTVLNERRQPQLRIKGPLFFCSCCRDVTFEVKTLDDSMLIGHISKQWSGFLREVYTDSDHFGIVFPMDLDVKMKAVLLGACFLIDFLYFEERKGDKKH
ncbi:phospholipid scramblase 2-like [Oncorhynchus keta]|uniref:phospholipid scramblase 2-like n=1 Tax=Oncorhynchus keta TaxID=8018 RepID=UPI0015FC75E4|nr:phospholipid scramblase 2-like [Oncorhynchus keta]